MTAPSLREAATMALEALCMPCDRWNGTQAKIVSKAIEALHAALAPPEAEPVALVQDGALRWNITSPTFSVPLSFLSGTHMLYSAPQPAPVERKPLTDREAYAALATTCDEPEPFEDIAGDVAAWGEVMEVVRAIEHAHNIKGAA